MHAVDEDSGGNFALHLSVEARVAKSTIEHLLQEHPEAARRLNHNHNLPIHYAIQNLVDGKHLNVDAGASAEDIENFDEEIFELLLSHYPAGAGVVDFSGNLCLHDAVRGKLSLRVCSLLITAFPEALQMRDSAGDLPIQILMQQREPNLEFMEVLYDRQIAESLLDYGLKVGVPDAMIAWLLTKQRVDGSTFQPVRDQNLNTPLHTALKYRASTVVILLLVSEYPEFILEPDADGHLPLHLACWKKYSVIVVQELIAKCPQSVLIKDDHGRLPLHIAAANAASVETIDALLATFSSAASEASHDGLLPLHYAAENQSSDDVIESLVRVYPEGARSADSKGFLPIHLAVSSSCTPSAISVLLRAHPHGVSIPRPTDGSLPLHIAASRRVQVGVIKTLLSVYPAAAQMRDAHGSIPIRLALLACTTEVSSSMTPSLECIILLLLAHPVTPEHPDLRGINFSTLRAPDRGVLLAMMRAVKARSQVSAIHIHMCGHACSGKTTARTGLSQALRRGWLSFHLFPTIDMLKPSLLPLTMSSTALSSIIGGCRNESGTMHTMGMECEIIDRSGRRFILHDYGGQEEFHVTHSRFFGCSWLHLCYSCGTLGHCRKPAYR